MAKKSKISSTRPSSGTQNHEVKVDRPYLSVIRAVVLVLLAAIYSPISTSTLAPVYGSTPSNTFHRGLTIAAIFAGSIIRHRLPRIIGQKDVVILPVLVLFIPTLQHYLFQKSSTLGNPVGPLVTELLTFAPVVVLSVTASSTLLKVLRLEEYGPQTAEHAPLIGILVLYSLTEQATRLFLPRIIGTSLLFTSSALQLVLGLLYSITLPSLWVLIAIPSIIFSTSSNVHMPWPQTTLALNTSLHNYGYSLVDRQESLTGYISVIDNVQAGFRAMRCDHSLLGGDWRQPPPNYHPVLNDPIYAVFTMLEAVRLVETDDGKPRSADEDSQALVMYDHSINPQLIATFYLTGFHSGLGIGTTPAALISHGINTTIVEIDPVVHKFAMQHFQLPKNHTAVIQDATKFVRNAQKESKSQQYDYIVHDVFTGGVEPVALFTYEFLEGLDYLLKDDGVIAIVS
jgi:hypothetical protein